ncbi:MAG: HlyD family efflux transporter periplasmic adaptor subunit [Syntrophomonadaceae bacterium]|nr:HlyD family efflux transporter periplasmic adaptor subunit [Syntrophomonadaceae bacterium]
MKKRVKWLLWGMVVVALVGASVYSATRPIQADLLEVKPRTIEKKFTESGTITAAWQKDFFSLTSGKVLTIDVQEGETVAAGEALLALDTRDVGYQIAQLQGQLASIQGQEKQAFSGPKETQITQQRLALELAQEQLKAAQEDYQRIEVLYEAGAVSQLNLDEATRAVKQLELLSAQQEQGLKLLLDDSSPPEGTKEQFAGLQASIRAQIALLEYQKENAQLTAPEEATVGTVHVKEGAVVTPGTALLSLFRPGEYEVEVFLLPEDLVYVEPGQEVRVTYKGLSRDEEFSGTIKRIASAAEERISTLGLVEQRVKVTIGLSGEVSRLRPGYAMDVTIITQREEGRLVVPKTALFNYEGQSAVWVSRGGKAEIQPVEEGLETDDEVAVVSGLTEGDWVIRNTRLDGLKEGARIAQ